MTGRIERVSENLAVLLPASEVLDPPGCLVGMARAGAQSFLVDAGLQRGAAAVTAALQYLAWPAPPQAVFLTHLHGDHVSGAIGLCRSNATRIYAHPDAARMLASAHEPGDPEDQWALQRCDAVAVAEGERVEIGGAIVTAFHTPGHVAQACSWVVERDGRRCVFMGDLVMLDLNPGWRGDPDFSIGQTLASLHKLRGLEGDLLFTGHGVVEGDPQQFLDRAIAAGESGRWDGPTRG